MCWESGVLKRRMISVSSANGRMSELNKLACASLSGRASQRPLFKAEKITPFVDLHLCIRLTAEQPA